MGTEKRKIDSIQKILLGGLKQKIHIKTEDDSLPVLLFLHGGPGLPDRYAVMSSHNDLLDTFTLVAWDQRGTGGSRWGAKKESLTIQRLTDDAAELADFLRKEFKKDKIFIFGESWGTTLGSSLAYHYPEKIAAYVGSGQVVDGPENERLSYEFTMTEAKKAGDEESIKILSGVGPPVNGIYKGGFKGLMAERKIVMKYGGNARKSKGANLKGPRFYILAAKSFFKPDEYSIADLLGILFGATYVCAAMWPEVSGVKNAEAYPEFQMPYFIFHGRYDYTTPAPLVEEYIHTIKAPRKELFWFEESSHMARSEEPEKCKNLLRKLFTEVAEAEREKGVIV